MPNKHPTTFNLGGDYELAEVQQLAGVTLDSPAREVLLDFRLHPALTVEPDTPLDEARHFLDNSHAALVLVVDRKGHFRGVITEDNLTQQSVMRLVGLGRRREDLQVRDLMTSRDAINAIDHHEFFRLSVGKVISTLKQGGISFMMVVDRQSEEIIGFISAKKLAKIFNLQLEIEHHASFKELVDAVMH